jgi:hypothetical protein
METIEQLSERLDATLAGAFTQALGFEALLFVAEVLIESHPEPRQLLAAWQRRRETHGGLPAHLAAVPGAEARFEQMLAPLNQRARRRAETSGTS